MNRALVIRYGNPQIANAIETGMAMGYHRRTKRDRRFERTRRKWARKYRTRPVHPVVGAILGVWALLWLTVAQLSAMNRS